MESIKCQYIRTISCKAKPGEIPFVVAKFKSCVGEKLHISISGPYFIAMGYGFDQEISSFYMLKGIWDRSEKYGDYSFRVQIAEPFVPMDRAAILDYLISVEQIGPEFAQEIYDTPGFGLQTLDVLYRTPAVLCKVRMIPRERIKSIIDYFQKSRAKQELALVLSEYDLTKKEIDALYDAYQKEAVSRAKENPFLLTSVKGIGYRKIDAVVRKKGILLDTTPRIQSAVFCSLEDAESEGHVYATPEELLYYTMKLLNRGLRNRVVETDCVRKIVNQMVESGAVIYNTGIYRTERFIAEDGSAKLISLKLQHHPDKFDGVDLESEIQLMQRDGLELAECQKTAIKKALSSSFSIITGGPGTGKTTTLKCIVDLLLAHRYAKESILLAAPTGRAARRMAWSTGRPATTIHKMLGIGIEQTDKVLLLADAAFVIVDEASMIDMDMLYKLLSALPDDTQLVLVGDCEQLPSVGPGDVLRQLIETDRIPVVRLNRVYRQADGSLIAENAPRIIAGDTNLTFGPDFTFLPAKENDMVIRQILQQYQELHSQYGAVQILCPVWKSERGVGVTHLNEEIQNFVNPHRDGELEYRTKTKCFRKRDRVMQLRNDEVNELNNGDIGVIVDIKENPQDRKNPILYVQFENGNPENLVPYDTGNINQLTLSYAITIHKAQGTEFPAVIILLSSCYGKMLIRNLLYTAVTRAREKVVVVGEMSAFCKAIRTDDFYKRNTLLAARLRAYVDNGKCEDQKQAA